MSRSANKNAASMLALAVVCAIAWLWLGPRRERASQKARFVSCQNHRNHLWFALRMAQHELKNPHYVPHVPGVDGAMLWTAFGRPPGNHNCHHGAPRRQFGGWQGVNLPREKWDEVGRRWFAATGSVDVPLFWCGGPDPSNRRVFTTVRLSNRSETYFEKDVLPEAECAHRIAQLNEILLAIGERPVPLNVPDNVDWDKAPPWSTPEWRKPPTTRTNSTPPLPSASFRP